MYIYIYIHTQLSLGTIRTKINRQLSNIHHFPHRLSILDFKDPWKSPTNFLILLLHLPTLSKGQRGREESRSPTSREHDRGRGWTTPNNLTLTFHGMATTWQRCRRVVVPSLLPLSLSDDREIGGCLDGWHGYVQHRLIHHVVFRRAGGGDHSHLRPANEHGPQRDILMFSRPFLLLRATILRKSFSSFNKPRIHLPRGEEDSWGKRERMAWREMDDRYFYSFTIMHD